MSPAEAASSQEERETAGESTRLFLLIAVSAVFVVVVNGATVNVALPAIQEAFDSTESQASWIITGYLLVFAVGIPLYGRLADVYSLRKAFSFGLVGFIVGSLACAVAPSLLILVCGRVVQAAGAAAIPALSTTSVAKLLPPGRRGAALGMIVSSVGVGAAVGPIIGGAAIQFAGWHVLFYGVLILGVILLIGALLALPDTPPDSAGRSFDLPGGLLLALCAGFALFGVTQGEVSGFSSPFSWGFFLASVLCGVLFARRIKNVPEPFVSPGLLENRAYLICAVAGYFGMFANLTSVIVVPLMLSQADGFSAGVAGLVLAPGAVAVAILSPMAGRLSDRVGTRLPILFGLSVMLVSILSISTFAAGASPYVVAAGMLGVGAGFSMFNSPNTNAAASTLKDEEIGVGLGIYQMLFFLGGGSGPALMGAFLTARRESGAGALNPIYALDAPHFSDTFLLLGICLLIALLAAALVSPAELPGDPVVRPSGDQ